jgi:hypothetical protein
MGGTRKNLSLNGIPWEEMRRLMETDARVSNEEMTSKLLKDGSALTLGHLDNDYAFLLTLSGWKLNSYKIFSIHYEIAIKNTQGIEVSKEKGRIFSSKEERTPAFSFVIQNNCEAHWQSRLSLPAGNDLSQ